MLTTTRGCNRIVLVRNAQTEKNKRETVGDFTNTDNNDEYVLTENGGFMSHALGSLIEYLELKRHPSSLEGEPQRNYTIIIDSSTPTHRLTAQHLLENYASVDVIHTDDINDFIKYWAAGAPIFNKIINTFIVFTSGDNIITEVRKHTNPDFMFGPALCSTSILDIFDDRVFIHELGGLGALAFGGYTIQHILMWNNSP